MPEITYEDLAAGLRARTDLPELVAAAVGLLLRLDSWLRREDFRRACATTSPAGINWQAAREFYNSGPPAAATSQMIVLEVALALVEDQHNFRHLGVVHRYRVAEAFAAALGQALTGPEPVPHNHPEFIPADWGTCPACDAPAAPALPPEIVTAAIARTSGHAAAEVWAMAGGTTVGSLLARKELITSAVLAAAAHFGDEIDRQGLAAIEEATLAERSRLFVAIRHGIPLSIPWRGEALDLIFALLDPPEDEAT